MLRGRFDAGAPPDPDIPPPRLRSVGRELVSGIVLFVGLLLVGVVLRFAV